jgi:hypothetical protein
VGVKLGLSHRLMAFENWLLREIFGSKRAGVAGEWRKWHNEAEYCQGNEIS